MDQRVALTFPNGKMLDQSVLKGFADSKIYVTQTLKLIMSTIENTVGKGENAGNQHFLLFPQCFEKASCTGSLSHDFVEKS